MDFIHGNSVIFGKCRSAVCNDPTENICSFCNKVGDDSTHQMFECEKTRDGTYYKLIQVLRIDPTVPISKSFYVKNVIAPSFKKEQKIFIDRVKSLIQHHDTLQAAETETI